jgi:hypothetical protein
MGVSGVVSAELPISLPFFPFIHAFIHSINHSLPLLPALHMAAAQPATPAGLREVLRSRLGEASVVDYTDAQLQQLINRGWINENRLRLATLQNLLDAGLSKGQAAQLRAVLQGAFKPPTHHTALFDGVAEACCSRGTPCTLVCGCTHVCHTSQCCLHAWHASIPSEQWAHALFLCSTSS